MNNHYINRTNYKRIGAFSAFILACGAGALAAGAQQKNAGTARYGPFSISNIGQLEVVDNKSGKTPVRIDGPNLSAKSPRYDIAAPHISMILVKAGTPPRSHAQTVTGTGGVKVVYRPNSDETTTITCDRANYAATNPAKELGRLNLVGNVHSVRRSPDYGDTPLIQDWTSAYIEFLDNDSTRFVGENGNVSGAIKEPPPRPKKPAGKP